MKIPIKKYKMDESLSWEERYKQLEAHHKEETEWMMGKINELRELVGFVQLELEKSNTCNCMCDCGDRSMFYRGEDDW